MLILLSFALGKGAQRGKPGELCLRSPASGGAPLISFHGEGDCRAPKRHGGAPLATLRGATARIVESVLRDAGFEVEHVGHGEMNPRAALDYCSSTNAQLLARLQENQTVSQIPGYDAFTTKDALARNVNEYAKTHPEMADVIPRTYALPEDWERLTRDHDTYKGYYIVKPAAASRGRGIHLMSSADMAQIVDEFGGDFSRLPKKAREIGRAVAQRYQERPLLVNGYKFDCRVYLAITSSDPLVAYLYEDGLVRFATRPFEAPDAANEGELRMHLTNFALNSGENHQIQTLAGGMRSKWTLREFFAYLEKSPPSGWTGPAARAQAEGAIHEVLLKALTALSGKIAEEAAKTPTRAHAFGLYGADVLFDEDLNA